MFTTFIRTILLLVCTALSIIAAYYNIWTLLILSTIISLVLLFGFFRVGTIPLALKAIKMNDYIKLESVLMEINNPDRLMQPYRTYFYFSKGMLERNKDNLDAASNFFNIALLEGFKNEHYKAMTLLALTDIEMVKRNKTAARKYFEQMKNLKVHPNLMESIKKMQTYLA